MPWDSFLGRSARPAHSQVYGGGYHGCDTPPTHPPENFHHYGGSSVPGYGGDPRIPSIQEYGGHVPLVQEYGRHLGEAPSPPIPPVIFEQSPPAPMGHGVYPSGPASVVSSLGGVSTPMRSLAHVDA